MNWKDMKLPLIALVIFTLGVLVGAWLAPQVTGLRWQFEYARVQSEFNQYAQQVQPIVQQYQEAQRRAAGASETPQEAQQ